MCSIVIHSSGTAQSRRDFAMNSCDLASNADYTAGAIKTETASALIPISVFNGYIVTYMFYVHQ